MKSSELLELEVELHNFTVSVEYTPGEIHHVYVGEWEITSQLTQADRDHIEEQIF